MENKDLFAPPSKEELDMFAAPTQEELAGTHAISKGQSALQGAASGATLGLSDIIQGAGIAGISKLSNLITGDDAGVESAKEQLKKSQEKLLSTYEKKASTEKDPAKLQDLLSSYTSLKDQMNKPSDSGILSDYYAAKDVAKQSREQAEAANPGSYMAGALGGGALGTGAAGAVAKALPLASKVLPTATGLEAATGLGKVANLGIEGAKAGAISNFGQGNAQLLNGDVTDSAKELGQGAVGGAAVGGVLGGAMAGAGAVRLAGKTPIIEDVVTGLKYGLKGKPLTQDSVQSDIKTVAKSTYDAIQDRLSQLGADKASIMDIATDAGAEVNAGNTFKTALQKALETKAITTDSAQNKQKFIQFLQELQGQPLVEQKLEDTVAKRVSNLEAQGQKVESAIGDVNQRPTGLITTPTKTQVVGGDQVLTDAVNTDKLSLSDAKSVLDEVNKYTGALDSTPKINDPSIIRQARMLAKELNDNINDTTGTVMEGLPDIKQKISNLLMAKDKLGIGDRLAFGNEADVAEKVSKIQKMFTSTGDSAKIDRKQFLDYLGKSDQQLAQELNSSIDDVQKLKSLVNESSTAGSILSKAGLSKQAGNIGNLIGRAYNASVGAANDAIKSATKPATDQLLKIVDLAPENLKTIASKMMSSGNKDHAMFAAPLSKAATSTEQQKSAILYGLYQQPAFRQAMQSVAPEMLKEDKNNGMSK